jgi:hypothetical protein
MMGHRQVEQAALFYEFSLEKHIPADHLLRSIDRFVDLGEIKRDLAPLQQHRSAFDRSGAHDPDAADRLLLRHPIRVSDLAIPGAFAGQMASQQFIAHDQRIRLA